MDLDSFQIADLVIHDVPLPNEDGIDVILTDAPLELDADLRQYFRRKIIESLKKRGLDVITDPEESAVARESVRAILEDADQLVLRSHDLARHLFTIQNKANSEGLIAVATGSVDDGDVVAVLKLEREQGLRLQIVRDEGRTLADVEHLRNLTLTDKTKVFKTSILRLEQLDNESTCYGRASDDQRGIRAGEGVANFFLSKFLGCRLKINPEVATRDFVAAVEKFINGLDDQKRQAEYHIALLATLQDQQLDISPRAFAEANLRDDDRENYVAALHDVGLSPDTTFQKDLKLARSKGFTWYFEHGMTLIGSREDVEQRRVVVPKSRNKPVEIRDPLKRLRGR
jgi:nucleoid-associated protein YejK